MAEMLPEDAMRVFLNQISLCTARGQRITVKGLARMLDVPEDITREAVEILAREGLVLLAPDGAVKARVR